MNIDQHIKFWASLCESNDSLDRSNDLSEKYISYLLKKQDLRNTVSYYERKAESYIDRRAANSSRAMANDIKLQKADDEYNAFVNSPANKKLVKDFFNATDTTVKSKFPELGEVESLNVVNAREYSKTKYFILKTAKSKFLIMHTDFELVDATFSSREEAVSKIKELDRHSA